MTKLPPDSRRILQLVSMSTHYAFLSSPLLGLQEVRGRIHDLDLPDEKRVWVDELDRRNLPEDSFEILDDLFDRIRKSSVFIVLLSNERYGTPLPVGQEQAHASFWEAELFYAALSGKPIKVFWIESAGRKTETSPDPRLASLLQILRFALPRESWSGPYSPEGVVSAVREYLLTNEDVGKVGRELPRLVEALAVDRGLDAIGGSAERESLTFLNGYLHDPTVRPNVAVIETLLRSVQDLGNEERRLSRLWLVFRELSGSRIDEKENADLLPFWNSFFGAWSSAGSWYGLHAHLHLGVLSALTTQARVRQKMKTLRSSKWPQELTRYPGGPLASSRYSIARKMQSRKLKKWLLHAAMIDLERELAEGSQGPGNLFAIRGSIYRQLGAYRVAVRDYEEVLRVRRLSGASEAQIGEALSELGFGYLFCLRWGRGKDLLLEGVSLLSQGSRRIGFLIRAKRKLAIAYALTGHPFKARRELREAQLLARENGVLDQIRYASSLWNREI